MSLEQPSDTVLLASLARDDRVAFARLYERHAATVLRWLTARLRTPEAAEEALQEVFFVLWTKRQRITLHGTSLLPWLLVTARYEALTTERASPQHVALAEGTAEAPAASVETAVEERDLLSSVATAISSLSVVDQQIFEKCVIEGHSYAEAARTLDISPGSVRNRLSRLRRKLVGEFGPQRSN